MGLLRKSLGFLRGITEDFNGRVDVELLLMNIFGFMNFYLFIFVQISGTDRVGRMKFGM